jgi:hypothetical protein
MTFLLRRNRPTYSVSELRHAVNIRKTLRTLQDITYSAVFLRDNVPEIVHALVSDSLFKDTERKMGNAYRLTFSDVLST